LRVRRLKEECRGHERDGQYRDRYKSVKAEKSGETLGSERLGEL
jgi:hypothetical protein